MDTQEKIKELKDKSFELNTKCERLHEELNQLVFETCIMNMGMNGQICPYCHEHFESAQVMSVVNSPIKWKDPKEIQDKYYIPRYLRNADYTDIVDDVQLKCPNCGKDMLTYDEYYKEIKPKVDELQDAVVEFYANYADYLDALYDLRQERETSKAANLIHRRFMKLKRKIFGR